MIPLCNSDKLSVLGRKKEEKAFREWMAISVKVSEFYTGVLILTEKLALMGAPGCQKMDGQRPPKSLDFD